MNAMVLAAGRGTRLGQLGETVPKILVDVGGEPLLARQLRYLAENGVQRVVLNAHHLADQVERFVAEHPRAQDIEIVFEHRLLGTAGGVRNALGRLGEEAFVVLYGDVIIDEPLHAVSASHRRAQAAATLALYRSAHVDGKGTVELAANGTVCAFNEKAPGTVDGEALVNAGLYVVEPSLLAELPLGEPLDFGHDVFPQALARGAVLAAHMLPEPVIDMGTPGMLALARAQLS